MTSPSQEHLLGYLLGALEPTENEQLEHALASDPQLAKQLDQIARCLQPLESCRHQDGPPHGLADRTCNRIFAEAAAPVTPARHSVAAAMSPEYGGSDAASSWRLADFVVAAGVFISAGMLFFPAISSSRVQSLKAQCQNNLRQFGEAMNGYSLLNPRQEYPAIPKSGHSSFVGNTALVLNEHGLLPREDVMLCASSQLAREQRNNWRLPSRKEINNAQRDALVALRRMAGGSYALPLGYVDGERYTLGRNRSSENRALAADAPSSLIPNLTSLNHDGQGENVVFESGRTAYVLGCGADACGDPIYVNHHGAVGPGVEYADNVLAPGEVQPYPEFFPALDQN